MPKLIDHDAREIEVAEAAWRVLLRDGITKISVRNVAAEAGLATGSLRRSFPTQDSLLIFSLQLVQRRARDRILALEPGPTPRATAEACLMQLLPLDADRRVEMEVYHAMGSLALTSSALRPAYDQILADTRAACRVFLERLLRAGDLDAASLDLDRESAALHALVDGLALHLLAADPHDDGTDAARILSDYLDRLPGSTRH
jgi:AcrR family transcriptional regulator